MNKLDEIKHLGDQLEENQLDKMVIKINKLITNVNELSEDRNESFPNKKELKSIGPLRRTI